MINKMYGSVDSESISAKPRYRFEQIQSKYESILGNRNLITDLKWRPS